jgi:hypothetical protein
MKITIHYVFWGNQNTVFEINKDANNGIKIRRGVVNDLKYFSKNKIKQALIVKNPYFLMA